MLNKFIRRYFFSLSSERSKEAKKITITPDLRLPLARRRDSSDRASCLLAGVNFPLSKRVLEVFSTNQEQSRSSVTFFFIFPRLGHQLRVLTLKSDWFVRLFLASVIGQCRKQPRFHGISSSCPLERSWIIYFVFLLLALGGEPL